MLQEQTPEELLKRIQNKETFVLNVVTTWCSDCTERQAPHFQAFVERMEKEGVFVYQCVVQKDKLVFLSDSHEALTTELGGHGYPRTTLLMNGQVVESRVEVMDALALDMLAGEFVKILNA